MGAKKGEVVDHINGDGIDNRKSNLRVVTGTINSRNTDKVRIDSTSGYRGVCLRKRSGRYFAYINQDGHQLSCGYHDSAEEAYLARLQKEKELWGIEPRRMLAFQAAGLA